MPRFVPVTATLLGVGEAVQDHVEPSAKAANLLKRLPLALNIPDLGEAGAILMVSAPIFARDVGLFVLKRALRLQAARATRR